MKMLETIHILPVRAESAAPAPLRGKKLDQRAVLQVVHKVDWKKAGLIAGGVTVVCAAAGTASRYKFYQGIVAREGRELVLLDPDYVTELAEFGEEG